MCLGTEYVVKTIVNDDSLVLVACLAARLWPTCNEISLYLKQQSLPFYYNVHVSAYVLFIDINAVGHTDIRTAKMKVL